MKLDFICKKCGSIEYEIKDKSNGTGIAHGLYCAKCGFWHKWIGKEELKRFSETKQKEKVYSVDEVNHLISEMDKVIAELKTENAELRERLEKSVELPCIEIKKHTAPKVIYNLIYRNELGNIIVYEYPEFLKNVAEAHLAELKGGKE